jgi:hypothetical protein
VADTASGMGAVSMDEDMDDELAKALALSMETDEPLQVVTRTSFGVSLCGSLSLSASITRCTSRRAVDHCVKESWRRKRRTCSTTLASSTRSSPRLMASTPTTQCDCPTHSLRPVLAALRRNFDSVRAEHPGGVGRAERTEGRGRQQEVRPRPRAALSMDRPSRSHRRVARAQGAPMGGLIAARHAHHAKSKHFREACGRSDRSRESWGRPLSLYRDPGVPIFRRFGWPACVQCARGFSVEGGW